MMGDKTSEVTVKEKISAYPPQVLQDELQHTHMWNEKKGISYHTT